jgi:Fuc2NAc and GlcNAc transferase
VHSVWWAVMAAFVVSVMLTGVMRRIALVKGIIDRPNERSSHSIPTPRGGGAAILVGSVLLIATLSWLQAIELHLAIALIGGGLLVGWVGFIDDRGSASVRLRFSLHLVAAMLAVYLLGGLPPLQIGRESFDLGLAGDVLAVVAIVWVLNLFNFMDGIDGIAASQAVFVTGSAAWLAILAGASASTSIASLVIAAASFGFLIWNWPPAKIFMGDVGSGFLGYVIAVLALASGRDNSVMLFIWLILGGVFFTDATVTLVRRLLRRERVYEAHRSHAYQWLSRRWLSHLRVTLTVCALNIAWLLPWAWTCIRHPHLALVFLAVALVPLVILAVLVGAGRSEKTSCL